MSHDDLPAELDAVARRLEALPDDAWAPPETPPLRLPDEAPVPADATGRGGWLRRGLTLRAPALVAASVALVALGIGLGRLGDEDPAATGTLVTLGPIGSAAATAGGSARIAERRVVLEVRGLAPSKPGQAYEAWLLNSASDLLPLGTFTVDAAGTTTVEMPLPAGAERFGAIDVSLEPLDGDPRHSSDSVLRATI